MKPATSQAVGRERPLNNLVVKHVDNAARMVISQ
jgi:hypothetical protein